MSRQTLGIVIYVVFVTGAPAALGLVVWLCYPSILSAASWSILAALVLLGWVWFLIALIRAFRASWQAGRDLDALVAELDARGEPWRWEDLPVSQPATADEQKACALIADVVSKVPAEVYTKGNFQHWLHRSPQAPLTREDFEASDERIEEFAAEMAAARRVNELPIGHFRFPWLDAKFWPEVSGMTQARSFGQLLHFAAFWHSYIGDRATALEDCLALQRVGLTLSGDSSSVEFLVRLAIQYMALGSLEHVLAQGSPAPVCLDRLQQICVADVSTTILLDCCRAERAAPHRQYEMIASGKTGVLKVIATIQKKSLFRAIATYPFVALRVKPAYAAYIRNETKLEAVLKLPDPRAYETWRDRLDEKPDTPACPFPIVGPNRVRQFFEAYWRVQARLRCALVALAVERLRISHGDWPPSLDELCPAYLDAVPSDPFTGKPLLYGRTPDGVVIYSVGPNVASPLASDQGLPANQVNFEYAFRLWDVPYRGRQYPAIPASTGITSAWPGWQQITPS